MEKPKKKDKENGRKFYSDSVDDGIWDRYSVRKDYIEKDEEKVIRINWFCKNYDVSLKAFKKVIDGLCKSNIVRKDCKLVYEIEIE